MPTLEVIDISWSQRRPVQYDEKEERYKLDSENDRRLEDSGFYCIYGSHPVYGSDVLLYIGETKLSQGGQRNFSVRFDEHFKGRFWYHQNLSYSTGVADQPLSNSQTLILESILIAAHKPALNRDHIDRAKEGSERYLIRNWDFPGVLQFECSGGYWRQ
ncbi:MAG: hypothetical protein CME75_02670 [Halomonas sp.]|nr:hypothetical protein [Halomonas sp.]